MTISMLIDILNNIKELEGDIKVLVVDKDRVIDEVLGIPGILTGSNGIERFVMLIKC